MSSSRLPPRADVPLTQRQLSMSNQIDELRAATAELVAAKDALTTAKKDMHHSEATQIKRVKGMVTKAVEQAMRATLALLVADASLKISQQGTEAQLEMNRSMNEACHTIRGKVEKTVDEVTVKAAPQACAKFLADDPGTHEAFRHLHDNLEKKLETDAAAILLKLCTNDEVVHSIRLAIRGELESRINQLQWDVQATRKETTDVDTRHTRTQIITGVLFVATGVALYVLKQQTTPI
eukprot:m.194455 g.194455  ORF g.194455 m.194455 type:complete len:237 (+) comp32529_c0_seq2:49-759(+)